MLKMPFDPRGLSMTNAGHIVVTECDSSQAHIYTPDGRQLSTITTPDKSVIFDVACYKDNLYVTQCNTNSGKIFMYDMKGIHKNTINVGYKTIGGISVTDDYIFVTSQEENLVYRLDISGQNKQVFVKQTAWKQVLGLNDGLSEPSYIHSNGHSVAVSCNNHKVFVYDMDAKCQFAYGHRGYGPGSGQLKYPHGVGLDSADRLLVCDERNSRVCIVSPQGQHLKDIDGLQHPMCLTLPKDGQVIVGCVETIATFEY